MRVLCVNTGSSSLKLALVAPGAAPWRSRREGLDTEEAFHGALTAGVAALPQPPDAVVHRIVAPDTAWAGARRVDGALLAALSARVPQAPDHLPQALAAIRAAQAAYASLPHLAASDSSFHRTLPEVARQVALPLAWRQRGIGRYGYHGLSCASVIAALRMEHDLPSRLVIAHLGNGCSLTAVREGQSVETTMGFTPLGGLVMSTRSGDLDPGVLLYLQRQRATAAVMNTMLNHEAGLMGLSGSSGDMKALLADPRPEAELAVAVFLYQARKHLGAMAAVLGGVDLLVFTGGIGENAAAIRERTAAGMDWLSPAGTLRTRVVAANEEAVMAQMANQALLAPAPVERKES